MKQAITIFLLSFLFACCLFKQKKEETTVFLTLYNFMEVDPQRSTMLIFLNDQNESVYLLTQNTINFDFNIIKGKRVGFPVDTETGLIKIETDKLKKRYDRK